MKTLNVVLLAVLSGIMPASHALAQTTDQSGVQLTASLRLRAEAWNWFDAPPADDDYQFGAALARVAAAQRLRGLSWRVELAVPVLIGLPEDAVAPAPAGQLGLGAAYWAANDSSQNPASVFLKQAFLLVGAPTGATGAALRIGRFEFIEGTETTPANATVAALKRDRIAHRLIGNFGFSHVQRSMDGLHFTWDGPRVNVSATAFRPTRGVFDVEGWGDLNIPVAYASLNSRGAANSDWRLFAVGYNDRRDVLKVDNRAVAARAADAEQIELLTLGGHYVQAFSFGSTTVDVLLWGAGQVGDWGALSQRAYALAAETGIQLGALTALKPWVRFGYNRSSGDSDNSDDEHGTFFQLLPTPRIYARFPFYNLMNTEDAFASLILRPRARLSLRADAHALRLTESSDLWYAGGGAFEKGSFGYAGRPSNGLRNLASLYDVSAEFRPNPHFTLTGYFGYADGSSVVQMIYPTGSNASLGYIELEWRR